LQVLHQRFSLSDIVRLPDNTQAGVSQQSTQFTAKGGTVVYDQYIGHGEWRMTNITYRIAYTSAVVIGVRYCFYRKGMVLRY
jgi:hypothetical protein